MNRLVGLMALIALLAFAACGNDVSKKGAKNSASNNATVLNNSTVGNNVVTPNNTTTGNNATAGNNNTSGNNTTANNTTGNNTTGNNTSGNNTGGRCQPGSCAGFQYCEQDSGQCVLGCERSDQCPTNFVCNLDHSCECPAGGDRLQCDATCSVCPQQNVVDVDCNDADECVAAACDGGYSPCATGCCANTTAGWQREVIDNIDTWSLDLAIGTVNELHVSYAAYGVFDLKYARRGPNGWVTSTLDSAGDAGFASAIDTDRNGYPHIAYRSGINTNYIFFDGGSWSTPQAVVIDAWFGLDIIAPDPLDLLPAQITYHTNSNQLRRAVESGTGNWIQDVIDSMNAGGDSSIAVRSGDYYVSYQDTGTDDLRLANGNDVFGWDDYLVDGVGRVGFESSIAVGSVGQIHIAYLDLTSNTNAMLKYATGTIGNWQIEVVDSANAGEYATLVLDGMGNPHVVYRDVGNGGLKYAVRSGNAWNVQVVDSSPNAGWYSRIVLDSNNAPHIVHQDLDADELVYLHQ